MTVWPSVPGIRPPVLEGRDLTKVFASYHRTGLLPRRASLAAVDGVSIALEEGKVTALVGESGSGKSVLSKMLARIVKPTAGELFMDGNAVPVGPSHRREYARHVQLVLQDPFSSMNPVHTIRYHLARALRIHGTRRDELDARIAELLERVALTPPDRFAASYPHELSGGQLQRVSVARALAARPRVLLADEPVSMLDVSVRLGLLNLLADLRDKEKLAILYITHDIASARYLADEILVMYLGQIVESAPADDLTGSPSHPYTQLLISSSPDPERLGQPPQLKAIRSSAGDSASGCRFRPRCPFAMPVCGEQAPSLRTAAASHLSRCWLAGQRAPADPYPPTDHAGAPAPDSEGKEVASTPEA